MRLERVQRVVKTALLAALSGGRQCLPMGFRLLPCYVVGVLLATAGCQDMTAPAKSQVPLRVAGQLGLQSVSAGVLHTCGIAARESRTAGAGTAMENWGMRRLPIASPPPPWWARAGLFASAPAEVIR